MNFLKKAFLGMSFMMTSSCIEVPEKTVYIDKFDKKTRDYIDITFIDYQKNNEDIFVFKRGQNNRKIEFVYEKQNISKSEVDSLVNIYHKTGKVPFFE